ncbi:hypothetical protein K435DRAFT_450798 [Dendrothele bispora CBS 962.96]|uniref:Uncharacterized protein n=1 Tax=Dendrothele bispora (strain CBS 962.96) TaxID=1314807 RepID=A0A4S8MTV4_DENBC|nr:hypothetical protein K435DRAFT_450798 [Dendrothele bispora CBS 962.96]
MEGIPESLRPGAEISDSPNFVPVDVYGPADFQSPGTSAYPFPHVGDECPCICGMCCCRTHAAQAPREPVQQARLEELDDDNETIGPGSSISGPPSSVGRSTMGPHVTNVDPFNLRSQEEPPESIIEEEPLPVQLNLIEPIGDPAFSPNLMSPVPERVNPISPLAYSPLGLDVFPASPAVQIPPPLGNLSEENFPEFPVPDQWQEVEQTPPPPRPNFNIILQDPPDFPPAHRKTIQVILRIKPVFVDCLDVLHDILPVRVFLH